MRIWIISDLHLEFSQIKKLKPPKADVCVVAGDVLNKGIIASLKWLDEHVAIHMPTIFVAGNHEFYRASKSFNDEIMYAQGYEASGRLEFLENSSVEFGGVRFIGTTLWTDFGLFGEEWSEIAMRNAAMSLNDYRLIKFEKDPFSRFTPGLSRLKHVRSRHCIESALLAFHDQKTVVVSHHAPSIWSIEDRFLDDLLTASYASNLEEVMIRHQPALWIHGHVHHQVDYTLGKTRVIANPRGYPDEPSHRDYDFGYVVEL